MNRKKAKMSAEEKKKISARQTQTYSIRVMIYHAELSRAQNLPLNEKSFWKSCAIIVTSHREQRKCVSLCVT